MLQRKSFQVAALSPVQWADAAPVPGKELLQHQATGGSGSVIAWVGWHLKDRHAADQALDSR